MHGAGVHAAADDFETCSALCELGAPRCVATDCQIKTSGERKSDRPDRGGGVWTPVWLGQGGISLERGALVGEMIVGNVWYESNIGRQVPIRENATRRSRRIDGGSDWANGDGAWVGSKVC